MKTPNELIYLIDRVKYAKESFDTLMLLEHLQRMLADDLRIYDAAQKDAVSSAELDGFDRGRACVYDSVCSLADKIDPDAKAKTLSKLLTALKEVL